MSARSARRMVSSSGLGPGAGLAASQLTMWEPPEGAERLRQLATGDREEPSLLLLGSPAPELRPVLEGGPHVHGVVGPGRIGTAVATRARAFGMATGSWAVIVTRARLAAASDIRGAVWRTGRPVSGSGLPLVVTSAPEKSPPVATPCTSRCRRSPTTR